MEALETCACANNEVVETQREAHPRSSAHKHGLMPPNKRATPLVVDPEIAPMTCPPFLDDINYPVT